MRKSILLTFAATGALLMGCAPATTPDTDDDGAASSVATSSSSSSARAGVTASVAVSVAAGTTSSAAAVVPPTPSAKTIRITVDNWSFSPNVIRVKKGEKVTVVLDGKAGTHSYAVPGLGINQVVSAGQTVSFQLPTDTTGTFEAMCRVPCGPGHKDMKATVIVE